jgi:hypothetical protein
MFEFYLHIGLSVLTGGTTYRKKVVFINFTEEKERSSWQPT